MKRCLLGVLAVFLFARCGAEAPAKKLPVAMTTSLDASGLWEVLSTEFTRDSGIELQPFVVGSGQALNLARSGEAAVAITHDPDAETKFVGEQRVRIYKQFMWNDFVIVGPPGDPAGVSQARSAVDGFRLIAGTKSGFCSRGDQSGTHSREMKLWKEAGLDPTVNPNYRSMGQPMAHLLRAASELRSYALADRATTVRLAGTIELKILFSGDPVLRNIYAVTVMEGDRYEPDARRFAEWLVSARGRSIVEEFRINGQRQFFWMAK